MSLVIEVPEELLALLRRNAAAQGKDVNTYAVAALSKAAQQDAVEIPPFPMRPGKPLAQFIDEQREKHNLPADWPHDPQHAMTDADWQALDEFHASENGKL